MSAPGTGPELGAWCQLGSPIAVEAVSSTGFDWIGIDRQHGLIGLETMVGMLQAAAISGTPCLVRTETAATAEIMKVLDAGAAGVIVPDVGDGAAAASVARACRYPPEGDRSWGPSRPALSSTPHTVAGANAAVRCFVMVESAAALARVDEIAAASGITGIFVGPVDLGLSCTGRVDGGFSGDEARERLATVARSCRQANVVAGIYAGSQPNSQVALELGYSLVAVQSDVGALMSGCRRTLKALRGSQ